MFIKKKNSQHHSAFVSKIDKSLSEFDRTHELSETQITEIKKYKHIFKLRSNATQLRKEKSIWDF